MAYERFTLGNNRNLFRNPEEETGLQMPPDLFAPNPASRIAPPLDMSSAFPRQRFDPTQVTPEVLPQPAKPSFSDEYSKIAGNRPERDRYRQMIDEAPTREQYKPNKMTRLGATLGGIAAGFRDPSKGIELAQSTLDRPFNEAQDTYEKKLRNVAGLAGMEGEDVQEKLRGFTLGRQDERNTEEFDQKLAEFKANQQYRADSLKAQGWHTYVDTKTGRLMSANPQTGEKQDLGPAGQSSKEIQDFEKEKMKLEHQYKTSENAQLVAGRADVAKIRGESAAATLRQRAAALKPGDMNIKALNDLAAFVARPEVGIGADDLDRYITMDPETKRVMVNPDKTENSGLFGLSRADSTDELMTKKALRELLNRSYGGQTQADVPPPPAGGRGQGAGPVGGHPFIDQNNRPRTIMPGTAADRFGGGPNQMMQPGDMNLHLPGDTNIQLPGVGGPQVPQVQKPPIPDDEVRVTNPKGVEGTIKKSELPNALKVGYKEVK